MHDIKTIPDEILWLILEKLPTFSGVSQDWTNARLVCKKWASIIEPRLFNSVSLVYRHGSASAPRVGTFLNLLQQKPHLRDYVLQLTLRVSKTDEWICTRIFQIFDQCNMIQALNLGFTLDDSDLPPLYIQAVHQRFRSILRRVSTMKLQYLSLVGVSFECVMTIFKDAEIDHLFLQGSSWSGDTSNPAPARFKPSDEYIKQFQACEGTCKIRSLWLTNWGGDPPGLSYFLAWSALRESKVS
jgi:hypothetical protein